MARQVAQHTNPAAQTSQAALPDTPKEFSIEALEKEQFTKRESGDMPDFDAPKENPGYSTPYRYQPSENTLKALDELPWEEISKELGITRDDLIKKTTEYGILEAFAYGSFTKSPIYLKFGGEHEKKVGKFCTIRLWHHTDAKTGKTDWGYETHPVGMKYKTDNEGEVELKDGKPVIIWDDNPIRKGDILKYAGVELTKDQTDQLRLTGFLEEQMTVTNFYGKPQHVVVGCDRFNRHCLIGVSTDVIYNRLARSPKVTVRKGENVDLTPKQVGELSVGHGVWLKTATGPAYVKYDVFQEKVRPATDFRKALRTELAQEEKIAQAKAAGRSVAEAKSIGMKR